METSSIRTQAWWPTAPERLRIAAQLRERASGWTTTALARIAENHRWFSDLDAENRSWITVIARSGIDGFVTWFEAGGEDPAVGIFDAAPRVLTRRITLHQTVDLVRTTIATVEAEIAGFPDTDREALQVGILSFSREVAFAAAEVYARAAEARGTWDARLEALVVDAVIRGDADEAVLSRASTLGWSSPDGLAVVIGSAPARPEGIDAVRLAATRHGLDLLAAQQGGRLVLLIGGRLPPPQAMTSVVADLSSEFGPGPVVVGPVVGDLTDAARSARAALSGIRAVHAWPEAPRPVAATELLPERALAGDGHARRELTNDVYRPLAAAGGDLLETLSSFFDSGGSVEATARSRYIHPNTVRYRLRRIQEVSGYAANDPRESYVLRLALTLGRLHDVR